MFVRSAFESRRTNVVLVVPLEANLQVVVLGDHFTESLEQVIRLLIRQLIDVLGERANGVDALPASDGVGAHDGVHGTELATDVSGMASGAFVDVVLVEKKATSDIGGGQSLEQLLVWLRELIVDVVATGPQGVAAIGGELGEAQGRKVGWVVLELNVRVPCKGVDALLLLVSVLQLLAVSGADGTDLGIADSKLRRVVEDGVDVQASFGGLAGKLTKALDELLLKIVG